MNQLLMKKRVFHIGMTMLLSCWYLLASAQVTVDKCEYWFDYAYDSRTPIPITDGNWVQQLDVGTLQPGLHVMACHVGTSDGRWSSVLVKNILVPYPSSFENNVLKDYEYWVDHDFEHKVSGTIAASGVIDLNLDFKTLSPGLHNIAFRVLDENGHTSSILVKNFLVPNPSSMEENVLKNYEYWVDHDFEHKVSGTIAASGIIDLDIDFSALAPGLHNIAFRVLDANGHTSTILVKNFLVPEPSSMTENGLYKYRYWIDRDVANAVEVDAPADGIISLDFDASALNDGPHEFSNQVIDKVGHFSATAIHHFIKETIQGESKLVGVDYWFNDDSRTRIAIDPAQVTIDKNDIVISLDGVQPRSISEDYTFDAATKTVKTTETITLGLQVFNDAEVGSGAVEHTIENVTFTVTPLFEALTDDVSDTKVAPQGGQVQGFSFDGAVGDSLHWELTGSDAKIDFFDANGNRLTPESKTIDEKDVLIIKMPTTTVYALTYGATEAGEMTVKVSIKVAYIQGDVNSDGVVNVTDIVATVNYIMDKPAPNFNKDAADVNGDGVINVTDIVMMVNIIMTGGGPSSSRRAAATGGLILHGKDVLLRDAGNYTAVQFDINLRDGQSVNDVVQCCSSDHQLTWKMVDAVTCRVVVYSMTNAAFHTNGDALMNIIMNGGVEDATISNEVLIRAEGTTGIDSYQQVKSYDVYDLRGNKVRQNATSLDGLSDGVYIINGKKVLHRRKK